MKTVKLGEVCDVNPRTVPPASDEEVSFVGMSELDSQSAIARIRESRTYSDVSNGYTVFKNGDILAAKITPCWENGKVGQASIPHNFGVGSTEFTVLRTHECLDSRYLLRFMRQNAINATGELRMTGSAGQRRVPVKFFQDLSIPLPPLPEQRRIAAILDQADAIRAKRRRMLEHLDSLTQSIFHEMFGTPSGVMENWPSELLGDRLDFLTSGSRGWAKYYAETGAKFLRINNVLSDEMRLDDLVYVQAPDTAEARRTVVHPGDVLMSITADLGRTAVVPPDIGVAHINQHLCILRSSAIIPRYLSVFIASQAGRRQIKRKNREAVKAGLNFNDVRSLRIPLPPDDLQSKFAAEASRVDAVRASEGAALAADDELFASLQYRAFRGEL